MKLKLTLILLLISLIYGCSVDVNPMKIEVRQNDNLIISETGVYDFGSIKIGDSSSEMEFTIYNLGYNDLELIGDPDMVQIFDDSYNCFTINQNSIISPVPQGSATSFTIKFKPNAYGIISAKIQIPYISDNYDPYTFTVKGLGLPTPDINVKQDTVNISSITGTFDFGLVFIGESSKEIVFTIENLGSDTLKLSGTPKVNVFGDIDDFTINQTLLGLTISPGNYDTFTITYTPQTTGSHTAQIYIDNNDFDEKPYTFTVSGRCKEHTTLFDFNGDGYDDIIIGAFNADEDEFNSGCAYIFFGSSNPLSSMDASDADVKIRGVNSYDYFGISVGNGDINNDGFDDALIGACGDDYSNRDSGCVFVFYGRSNPPKLMDSSDADVRIVGEYMFNDIGRSVACAGDVNADGYDDIITGSTRIGLNGETGCVYIIYGGSNLSPVIISRNANVIIYGDNDKDRFGCSVSGAGDVNKDGYDDVIVGAYFDDDGRQESGCAFIYLGGLAMASSDNASSIAYVKLIGENGGDYFGYSVSKAGDVNNDGYADVIVGAYEDDDGGSSSGCAFIFYGNFAHSGIIDAEEADVKIIGENSSNKLGIQVGEVGDINYDGYDDVIIGSTWYIANNVRKGAAYIIFGNKQLQSKINALQADIKIIGNYQNDALGASVGSAGDINLDGYEDIIVGAVGADDGGSGAGCAYIFFGGEKPTKNLDSTDFNIKYIGEDGGDNFGSSVAGGE